MEWVLNNLGFIIAIVLTLVSSITTFIINYKSKGASSALLSAMQVVNKMLPSLITTSENVNAGASGATKKAFVMTFVENMLAGRGLTVSDELRAQIGESIDAIVACTKTLHTGIKTGATSNENSRNDIDGITGLRTTA